MLQWSRSRWGIWSRLAEITHSHTRINNIRFYLYSAPIPSIFKRNNQIPYQMLQFTRSLPRSYQNLLILRGSVAGKAAVRYKLLQLQDNMQVSVSISRQNIWALFLISSKLYTVLISDHLLMGHLFNQHYMILIAGFFELPGEGVVDETKYRNNYLFLLSQIIS